MRHCSDDRAGRKVWHVYVPGASPGNTNIANDPARGAPLAVAEALERPGRPTVSPYAAGAGGLGPQEPVPDPPPALRRSPSPSPRPSWAGPAPSMVQPLLETLLSPH